MENELARYAAYNGGEEIVLTADDVRAQFCESATDKELALFAAQAKMFGANPWAREIYLVKYNNAPASNILSYHMFNQIATDQEDYDGIESGVIVFNQNTGKVSNNEGSAFFSQVGQVLVGGWAKVYKKGVSRPFTVTVNLSDFDKGTANWKSMKAFMIEKVAKAQAWRLAYPKLFKNVYDASEIESNKGRISAEQTPAVPDEVIIEDDETGASMDAKQALWNACKDYADDHGTDAKAVSDGIKKRPDYEESDEYFYVVADELSSAVRSETDDGE